MATSTVQEPRASRALPERPSVLAIVVTHQGRDWIRDCLVGLNTQDYELLDVLVVDDASPDARQQPSMKRIAKRHLRKRRWGYVRTPRPLGFGGAINWALSRVRTDADLLLFIHDDAALHPGSVTAMVERIRSDDSIAIVGPKIVSWDDPSILEEVGMAVDRFGYPYKGLEKGEIDLGQHDVASEVFYVTSTCMLMRHDVFRQLRGWDARMRAFSEDLDLCWRARLAGHIVRLEPAARARHAMALATGQRKSRFSPSRYFIRRNRLRAIVKNASGVRLVGLAPQFVLVALAEMLGFIVLRQPGEILNLIRAFGWNIVSLPQTLGARARVQRARKVQDRQLSRLTVRQSARIRVYMAHQTGRLEEAWGRRTELLSRPALWAGAIRARLRGRHIAVALLVLLGLTLGFRHYIWGPSASIGELLPYPDRPTAMWRAFLSPWHPAGLGGPEPAPPAFVPLGLVSFLTLGATGLAQKLLIVSLGSIAAIGIYKLLTDVTDRPARLVAAAAYVLGPVGYSGIREGALGALAFGAAAPFALQSMLRLTGWVRPPGWDGGREIARAAIAIAFSAAFVPGSLFLYGAVGLLLVVLRIPVAPKAARSLLGTGVSLVLGWALLLPWSGGWFSSGGILDRATSSGYEANFQGDSMGSVLLAQTPEAPALMGVALVLLGLVAVMTGEGIRRRVALAFWGVIALSGLLITFIAHGTIAPVVASPTEAAVPAALGFAGLAGLAVGAFRLDLPRRGLGAVHALTLGVLAVSAFLGLSAIGPALWHGEWAPGGSAGRLHSVVAEQLRSVMGADAETSGQFRALWVGEDWTSPRSAAFPRGVHLLTGSRGRILPDLYEPAAGPANEDLSRVIASIEEGTTDRGGGLLGAFNIRYVVLQPDDHPQAWLNQRDLEMARNERDYVLLRNTAHVTRAGLYDELPAYVETVEANDTRASSRATAQPRAVAEQISASSFRAERVDGPGTVFIAESFDEGWQASLGGVPLDDSDGGWGNAFEAPKGASGELSIRYPRPLGRLLWLIVLGFAWVVVLGAAFSRGKRRAAAVRGRA